MLGSKTLYLSIKTPTMVLKSERSRSISPWCVDGAGTGNKPDFCLKDGTGTAVKSNIFKVAKRGNLCTTWPSNDRQVINAAVQRGKKRLNLWQKLPPEEKPNVKL